MSKNDKLVISSENILEDYEFEINFFSYIAGTENFEIIPIPDLDGFIPSEEDHKVILEQYTKLGIKPLYRISMDNYALVYDTSLDKVGMVPEDNPHGFKC